MSGPPTTREAIVTLVRKEPGLSASEMAKRLGVSRERIRQLLDALNFEWHPGRWKKRSKR